MDTNSEGTTPIHEQIAMVCHEANRAYCLSIGDTSQPAWADAPEWQRTSAISGAKLHFDALRSGGQPIPSQTTHEAWVEEKRNSGWTYGPVKDPVLKTSLSRPLSEPSGRTAHEGLSVLRHRGGVSPRREGSGQGLPNTSPLQRHDIVVLGWKHGEPSTPGTRRRSEVRPGYLHMRIHPIR
jgi:hypothetical protein